MVKWIADITFEGKKEKKRFSQGEEFEMTVERAAEVEKNIKAKHDDIDSVMSRVEEKEVEEEQPVDTKEPAKKEEAKKSKEDSK